MYTQTNKRWFLAFFWLMLVSLLTGTFATNTQASGITAQTNNSFKMEVKAGLDSYYKENQWLPLQITLSNDNSNSPPISGRIEASFSNFSNDTQVYHRDIELIPPYRKTVWLYLNGPRVIRNVQVRLVTNDSTVLQSVQKDITSLDASSFLLGVISDDSSALNYLNGLQLVQPFKSYSAFLYGYNGNVNQALSSNTRTTIARLSPSDIPPQSAGLSALDGLIISDLTTTNLSAGLDQTTLRNTVGGWLATGKALIVAGDSGLRKVGSLAPLLPVTGGGSPKNSNSLPAFAEFIKATVPNVTQDLSGQQSLTVADAKLEPAGGGRIVAPISGNGPLMLATQAYGLGTSWFIGAELRDLRGWAGAEVFWKALFKNYQPRFDYATNARKTQTGNDWGYRLTPNPEVRERIEPWGLMIFLGIYILFIGPIGYIILKRTDRRELAWIIIPAFSVIFTIGAYLISNGGLNEDLLISRTQVITLAQGNDGQLNGTATGLATIYSNKRNEFDLNVNENTLFNPSFGDNYYPNSSLGRVAKQGPGAGYRGLFLGLQQNHSYSFENDSVNPAGEGIIADVRLVNGKLSGTLENKSGKDWTDVIVFVPSATTQKVGTLKAGEKKNIPDIAAVPGINLVETLTNSTSAQLTGSGNYRNGNNNYPLGVMMYRNENGKLVPDPDYRRALVLESFFGMSGEGLAVDNNRFYLVGWNSKAELPFAVPNKNIGTYDLSLLFQGLSFRG